MGLLLLLLNIFINVYFLKFLVQWTLVDETHIHRSSLRFFIIFKCVAQYGDQNLRSLLWNCIQTSGYKEKLTVEDMRNLLGLWGTRLEKAGSQRTTKYHCVSGGNRSIESIDLLSRQVRDPNLWLALSRSLCCLGVGRYAAPAPNQFHLLFCCLCQWNVYHVINGRKSSWPVNPQFLASCRPLPLPVPRRLVQTSRISQVNVSWWWRSL